MRPGTLAICGRGTLGMITEEQPKQITYKQCHPCAVGELNRSLCTCETGIAFVGIHLTSAIAPIGSPWSSRNPKVVGNIYDVIQEPQNETIYQHQSYPGPLGTSRG